MNKNKAIEYIKLAKEQLSDELLTVRFCQMARNNLEKALKELEDNMVQNNKQTMPDFFFEAFTSSKKKTRMAS